MLELLPEGSAVKDAEAVMTEAAAEFPAALAGSPQGEDRSNFQPVSSWQGDDFGFCKATESTNFTDATFAANWANLRDEGKPRGAYHYFHPSVSPIDQAHHFVSVVTAQGLHSADMLAADIEITVGADGTTLEFSTPQAAARSHLAASGLGSVTHAGVVGSSAKLFMDTVRELTGIDMQFMLTYTNLDVGAFLGAVAFAGYPLWIAYPSLTFPASVYPWAKSQTKFWQWEFGGGIGGGDRDAFMGSAADFKAYLKTSPPPPPPPASASLASKTGDEDMFYLPKGKNAAVTVAVPPFVPGSSGAVPTKLLLSTNAAAQFIWELGINSQDFQPFNVDYNRSPQAFELSQLAPGQQAIQFVRQDSGTNEVTACWA